jgi:polyribonucleotide nucleotidyltransferase
VNIDDDGLCQVAGPTQEKLQVALRMIGDLIQTAEVGKTYLGKVARFHFVSVSRDGMPRRWSSSAPS